MKKTLCLLVTCMLQCNSLVYATAVSEIKCPSATALIAAGLDKVEKSNWGETWIAYKTVELYDTDEYWNFFMWPIDGKNETKAFKKAIKLLSKVHFIGSRYGTDGSKWCDFQSGSKSLVISATNSVMNDLRTLLVY